MERWEEYFNELLNRENGRKEESLKEEDELEQNRRAEESITMEEIEEIIKNMGNNTSPGLDNLTAEMFKYSGEVKVITRKLILASEQIGLHINEGNTKVMVRNDENFEQNMKLKVQVNRNNGSKFEVVERFEHLWNKCVFVMSKVLNNKDIERTKSTIMQDSYQ